jgi:hypothetical protein
LVDRLSEQGRGDAEIELVDGDSTTVVSLLDNPAKMSFSTRGLVVGHVQSGKTGNMAAVINKAADTQYKFFLILSGMTDQLRNQTQFRLDTDVVGLAPDRWMPWTAADTDQVKGEFSHSAIGGFSFDHRNQIAVVKKNGAILRRLLAKLKNTDEATLRNTPFLIIDDECDQASVNSARYAHAITRINDLIRQILQKLPRAAYVGYTATPFANVLIDPSIPDDLYPRHFIHALERPAAYFGATELFGSHALNGEYDEGQEGYDMIRIVPPVDAAMLRPPPKGHGRVDLGETLRQAIQYFVMVVAARRHRENGPRNNSMLVHTSVLNSVHRKTEAVVRPYVDDLTKDLAGDNPKVLRKMAALWQEEQEAVLSEQFDRDPVPFGQIKPLLADAASSIRVHVENWTADARLSYEGEPHTYLVIGGNVLARGLTLEGLSVSYFLRSSSQYDTLMQMGRWFGYRPGFEDLPRVWVEDKVRDAFYDLATVEAEIRQDIRRYAEEEITPEQFGVRIRKIPGMAITAPAKMRNAVPVEIGYSGTHVQTFRFRRNDLDWLMANWSAAAQFLEAAAGRHAGSNVFRGVTVDLVLKFLGEYKPHESHRNLAPRFLNEFVRRNAAVGSRLAEWSVVVVEGDGTKSTELLGPLGRVRTVIRSAEANSGKEASIKALMSRRDVLRDLDGVQIPGDPGWDELKALREQHSADPLLLLYPIEAESRPRNSGRKRAEQPREMLAAAADVLGIGIVFPGSRQISGTYVSANIAPDLEEPADELEDEDRIPELMLDDAVSGGAS